MCGITSSMHWIGRMQDTGKDLDRILKRILPLFQKAGMCYFALRAPAALTLCCGDQAGYKNAVVLVDNLPSIAKRRLHGRFLKEGRYASDQYIEAGAMEEHKTKGTCQLPCALRLASPLLRTCRRTMRS